MAVRLSRSVYCTQPYPRDDGPIIEALLLLAEQFPGAGFGKMFELIRRRGHAWSQKRVCRVYRALKLNLRLKGKKRLPNRNPKPLTVPHAANICWSIDFMSDSLIDGRKSRTFNVVDDFNREALAIEIDTGTSDNPGPGENSRLVRYHRWTRKTGPRVKVDISASEES